MDIEVPLDVYIETLRAAAREGDSFQWSLGQFEWLLRNFRISDHSAVYEPEWPGCETRIPTTEKGQVEYFRRQLYES